MNFFECGNPFELSIEDKDEYTHEELSLIQKQLNDTGRLDTIHRFIESHYPTNRVFHTPLTSLQERCGRSGKQMIIDISNNILPTKTLFKFGDGGNGKNCFVCCTPILNNRCQLSQTISKSLEEVGFQGHFYLFNGGFPNPTGKEMKYIGVPYSFKIFMMLEAQKLGFQNIIWLDASCYAVNNPQRLFDILETDMCLFRSFPHDLFETYAHSVIPEALELLHKLTNTDVNTCRKICTIVFGLNLGSPRISKFIQDYYEMVKLGLPFISYYPEEVVYSAIFNKPEYTSLIPYHGECDKLFVYESYVGYSNENAKHNGFFFVQRGYP